MLNHGLAVTDHIFWKAEFNVTSRMITARPVESNPTFEWNLNDKVGETKRSQKATHRSMI